MIPCRPKQHGPALATSVTVTPLAQHTTHRIRGTDSMNAASSALRCSAGTASAQTSFCLRMSLPGGSGVVKVPWPLANVTVPGC